jgi:DNA-binding NtrC family response regulator
MPASILVVHSDADMREAALAALRAACHEAVGCEDPMVALEAIETESRLRLLVTSVDFGRGRLNGVALACMVRQKRPDLKAVFIALPEFEVHAAGLGEFLPMPLEPKVLVDTVDRLLVPEPDRIGATI